MTIKLALASTAIALGLAFSAGPAAASSPGPLEALKALAEGKSPVEQASYRKRCRKWAYICGDRWPGYGWRYRRCMRIRGC